MPLHQLNPQQAQAVRCTHGPVLILAGAGTGKTRVITERIVHLMERGVAPHHILAVTFTNKAAREMGIRVRGLMKKGALNRSPESQESKPLIGTFHSFCVRVLRQYIDRLGYRKHFVIYDTSDQVGIIRRLTSDWNKSQITVKPAEWLSLISRIKNAASAEQLGMEASTQKLAGRLMERYQAALKACNAVDFDDLILLVLELFEKHPAVLDACRQQYRYLMVDEYQDTNGQQFRLLKALAGEHQNLCVVGDDDQSIYGWRGAEIANLLNLEEHFPAIQIIKLEQNYRSTNIILNAANALIRHNPLRKDKTLWSEKGTGDLIRLMEFASDEAEATAVVEEIEVQRMSGRIPWKDQAILFRTNLQSRPLETALRQARVSYRLVGGQSYFDRREIKDVLAFLKVLINPDDDISLLRIANVPPRGLSSKTMQNLLALSEARSTSVWAVMRHTDLSDQLHAAASRSARALVSMFEERMAQLEEKSLMLGPWARTFLETIGYFGDLARSEKDPKVAENRVQGAKELLESIDTLTQSMGLVSGRERLESFLEAVALDQDRFDDKETEGEGVTLITMHSCKGLEFPHVHIVGLEQGLLPHSRSIDEGSMDEERRLFYVALTRAMKSLTLSHCATRQKFGQAMPCHPSSFLSELPSELIEIADDVFKKPVSASSGAAMFDALKNSLEL